MFVLIVKVKMYQRVYKENTLGPAKSPNHFQIKTAACL